MSKSQLSRRELVFLLGAALAWPRGSQAQPSRKVARIGFLRVGSPPNTFIGGFRQGLRELGYVEGENVIIEFGLARNAAELPDITAKLVQLKVDVIVASGTPSVVPAKEGAGPVPVVYIAAVDTVAAGIIASLARPGGNVTGVTAMHGDLIGKRFELMKELLPKLTKVAVMVRATSPATPKYVADAKSAATLLGVELQILAVRDPSELAGAIGKAQGVSALLVADDAVFTAQRTKIAELALKSRLPTIYGFGSMVRAGGLMAYGPHYGDLYQRAASQVHKILKGGKPADLPIEQPTKFEFMVNMRTALALGLEIPPALLARATAIIE